MDEFLTTRELAELLRIKERKVYDLAAAGDVPCTRAMGKLLFPRTAIEDWLSQNSSGPIKSQPTLPKVMLGSHDPLLDWALRQSQCGIASYFDSSEDGLKRFADGNGIATGLHLHDPASKDWNISQIREKFAGEPVVLVSWAKRQRGIMMPRREGARVTDLHGMVGKRIVPRQNEAGSQKLLLSLLEDAGIEQDQINWASPARSEADAALAVVNGEADAAFGLECIATQHQLGFTPVITEQYDLLIDRRAWFEPEFQAFFRFCHTQAFMTHGTSLGGYRFDEPFTVRFNGSE